MATTSLYKHGAMNEKRMPKAHWIEIAKHEDETEDLSSDREGEVLLTRPNDQDAGSYNLNLHCALMGLSFEKLQ